MICVAAVILAFAEEKFEKMIHSIVAILVEAGKIYMKVICDDPNIVVFAEEILV